MRRARSDAHWHIQRNLGADARPIRRVTDEALQCGGGVEPARRPPRVATFWDWLVSLCDGLSILRPSES
jgi:hypothetical protein